MLMLRAESACSAKARGAVATATPSLSLSSAAKRSASQGAPPHA